MKKTTLSALLLALTATGTLHAQMLVYSQNFDTATKQPDGQNLSTDAPAPNNNLTGSIAPTGGTGGTPADSISFDNSQYNVFGGGIGGYDSGNIVAPATATSLSNYVVSFDVKATNLAPNSDFTFTPSVTVVRSFGGNGSATITGKTPLTLTGGTAAANGFRHFSLNASTFTATSGNFATTISASDYDQTVFQLQLGNTQTPQGDLGSAAFNGGTSTIYIDNLQITQVAAGVPEPRPAKALGAGLALLGAWGVFRRRRAA